MVAKKRPKVVLLVGDMVTEFLMILEKSSKDFNMGICEQSIMVFLPVLHLRD